MRSKEAFAFLPRLALAFATLAFVAACSETTNAESSSATIRTASQSDTEVEHSINTDEAPRDLLEDAATISSFQLCGEGCRADTLFNPSCVEVSEDSRLSLGFDGSMQNLHTSLSITPLDGGEVTIVPEEAYLDGSLALGEWLSPYRSYKVTLDAVFADGSQESRDVTVAMPRVGALGVILMDWDSDGLEDRITITSDARIAFSNEESEAMPIGALNSVRDYATGDFDRDGHEDIALLGFDHEGQSTLLLLRHLANQQKGFRIEAYPEIGLALPIRLQTIDLFRDGSPDLIALGLDGEIRTLVNPIHSAEFTRRDDRLLNIETPKLQSGPVPGSLHILSNHFDGDGRADVIICGGESPRFLSASLFDRSGLVESDLLTTTQKELTNSAFGRAKLNAPIDFESIASSPQPLSERIGNADLVTLFPLMRSRFALVAYSLLRQELSIFYPDRGVLKSDLWSVRELGKINAVSLDPTQKALLIAGSKGVFELDWQIAESKPRLTFDSRVTFDKPELVGVLPAGMKSRSLIDVNDDGSLDIVGIFQDEDGEERVGIWLNYLNESGSLEFTLSFSAEGYDEVTPVDLSGNTLVDLLLTSRKGGRSKVLRGTGDYELFSEDQDFKPEIPNGLIGTPIVADFNSDDFDDVFWPTARGHISFGSLNRLSSPVELPRFDSHDGTRLRFGLMNRITQRNGVPHLISAMRIGKKTQMVLIHNHLFRGQTTTDSMIVELMGAPVEEVSDVLENRITFSESAILVMRRIGEDWELAAWRSGGIGFQRIEFFGERRHAPRSLHFIDIDGDSDADIAYLFDEDDDYFTLQINKGDGTFSTNTISSYSLAEANIGSRLEEASLHDLNGDGKPDLLAHSWNGEAWHASSRR